MAAFGQQTFSDEHWDRIVETLGGRVDVDAIGILYRASYSESFGADLRALIREVVIPTRIAEWDE